MMNAAAHTSASATRASVSNWTIAHAQKDSSELSAIILLVAQLSDVSHANTTQLLQQSELRHQSLTSSILNQLNQSLAHQLTTHVTTAKVTSDSTETAGHQKPAHTVNAMLTEKSDAARPNAPQ